MKNSEAILVTPKKFEIQECPVPEPKDNEILMKVEYVGMCGSDIHVIVVWKFNVLCLI